MIQANRIKDYVDKLYPNAVCELNYKKDYELLISVMLSAQTTDIRVNKVTAELFREYDSLEKLSNVDISKMIKIVRSLGSYTRKASAVIEISKRLLEDYDGLVPNDREYLESLPGVGRKTVNVVLNNLYNVPVMAVDTHVFRVSHRLGIAKETDSLLTVENKLYKTFDEKNIGKLHHQFVFFGRYKCKARSPECSTCELIDICKEKRKNL